MGEPETGGDLAIMRISEYDTFRLSEEMSENFDHQDVKIARNDSSNEPVDNRQSKKQFTPHPH